MDTSKDEVRKLNLDPGSIPPSRGFTRFVQSLGPFTWETGDKWLEMLREDIDNLSARLNVRASAREE